MTQIKLRNVSKKFHSILAVDNVTLQVDHGEYVVFLGPTGSGKSTVLKMIAGLVIPDSGSIYFDNEDVTEFPPEDRNVGFVFEQFALFPHLTLLRNATYGPWVRGYTLPEAAELAKEAIDMVLLTGREDAFPNELSGGMKQRLAIARTMVAGSKVMCLDEPLGALDAKIGLQLRYDLRQLIKDLELTALHATHNFEEAMLIADRIAIFQNGKIIQEGEPRKVYDHPNSIFVANFLGEANNLECRVQAVDSEFMKLEFQDTVFTIRTNIKQTKPSQYNKGDKVILVVKTEALRTHKGVRSGTNALVGTLEASQILGRFIKYRTDVGGTKIISKALPKRRQLLEEGTQVTLLFSPRKGHIFPFPENGIKEELYKK